MAESCPFCQRIAQGWYEAALGAGSGVVMFAPLDPVTVGHMLFVPYAHCTHDDRQAHIAVGRSMAAAQRYGQAAHEQFNLILSGGEEATQSVEHLHVHYIPRRAGDGLLLPWSGQKEGHDGWATLRSGREKIGVVREDLARSILQQDVVKVWATLQQ